MLLVLLLHTLAAVQLLPVAEPLLPLDVVLLPLDGVLLPLDGALPLPQPPPCHAHLATNVKYLVRTLSLTSNKNKQRHVCSIKFWLMINSFLCVCLNWDGGSFYTSACLFSLISFSLCSLACRRAFSSSARLLFSCKNQTLIISITIYNVHIRLCRIEANTCRKDSWKANKPPLVPWPSFRTLISSSLQPLNL